MKEIEIELRKKFVEDFDLPIVIPITPYFENALDTLEKYTGAKTKWEKFIKEQDIRSPGKFLQDLWGSRNEIIDHIKNSEGYQALENDQEISNQFSVADIYRSKEIYSGANVGGRFISVDLKTANFQALRFYDPAIVLDCSSWSEFVGEFSDSWALASGKRTRQSILGKLRPEKQVKIETYLMYSLDKLIHRKYPDLEVYSMKTDEIIYKVNSEENYDELLGDILWLAKNELDVFVKVDVFTFEPLQLFTAMGNSIYGFIKKHEDGSEVSFHKIPKQYILQFIKYYEGRSSEINDLDLSFMYQEQEIAKFVKPLSNENPNRL